MQHQPEDALVFLGDAGGHALRASACTDGDWRALYEPQSTITRAPAAAAPPARAHAAHRLLRVAGPAGPAVQHHVAVAVAGRLDAAPGDALLGDAQEGVAGRRSRSPPQWPRCCRHAAVALKPTGVDRPPDKSRGPRSRPCLVGVRVRVSWIEKTLTSDPATLTLISHPNALTCARWRPADEVRDELRRDRVDVPVRVRVDVRVRVRVGLGLGLGLGLGIGDGDVLGAPWAGPSAPAMSSRQHARLPEAPHAVVG